MLERELRELRVSWPETPDLAAAVGSRLASPVVGRRRVLRWPAWQVAVACAAAAIALTMAVPPARSAILEWLGFASVRIERAEPDRSRLGTGLALGRPVTLAEAQREAGFPVPVPSGLGRPDGVFMSRDQAAGARVDLVYGPRPGLPRAGTTGVGLLVTAFRSSTVLIEKSVGSGATVDQFEVGGDRAYFISGAEHGFAYTGGRTGGFEPQRLAGDTLLVERDGVLLRLEGELDREEAVRIALSTR
jgi:hypothetical protein